MILHGSGCSDGNRHTHVNLPLILAGAGKLMPGRYVQANSRPASNLFLGLADRMGVLGLPRFGDSTGRFNNI